MRLQLEKELCGERIGRRGSGERIRVLFASQAAG